MAQIGLVQNFVISSGSNIVHQVGSHALPHCMELPYWHYQLVLSWYLHQPESHQLSLNKVAQLVSCWHPDPKIGPRFTWVDKNKGLHGKPAQQRDLCQAWRYERTNFHSTWHTYKDEINGEPRTLVQISCGKCSIICFNTKAREYYRMF